MDKFRLRLDYVLVASLLLNAGLLGFFAALLLLPGPMPGLGRGVVVSRLDMVHGVTPPDFGFGDRLSLARLLERDAAAAGKRIRAAEDARQAFSDVLSQENPDKEEIIARGEELKAAMNDVGGGFLDAIVAAAPELGLDERRKLAVFLLRLPSPDLLLSPGGPVPPGSMGEGGLSGFAGPRFHSGPIPMPPEAGAFENELAGDRKE